MNTNIHIPSLLRSLRAWLHRQPHVVVSAVGFSVFAILLNGTLVVQTLQTLSDVRGRTPIIDTPRSSSSSSTHRLTPRERRKLRLVRRLELLARRQAGPSSASASASSRPMLTRASSSARAMPSLKAAAPVEQTRSGFPAFQTAVYPVSMTPNWGDMHSPSEWNRTYEEMTETDFVPVPHYDLSVLTTPLDSLIRPLRKENVPAVTTKLFYSTRYYSSYDLDAGEFTGAHAGLDLKLALGTPVGSVAGGRVHAVRTDDRLGLYVIVEHRAPDGETYYSVYGHLGDVSVQTGQAVNPGQTLGTVGMTGKTSGPHIHLQIDRGEAGEESHQPYATSATPSPEEADKYTINPADFIQRYAAPSMARR